MKPLSRLRLLQHPDSHAQQTKHSPCPSLQAAMTSAASPARIEHWQEFRGFNVLLVTYIGRFHQDAAGPPLGALLLELGKVMPMCLQTPPNWDFAKLTF